MRETKILCDRCKTTLYDSESGCNLPRYSVTLTFGYSESRTWGHRMDLVDLKSDDGLCEECFKEWWEWGNKLREWSGQKRVEMEDAFYDS
jgi:hypothetical protein